MLIKPHSSKNEYIRAGDVWVRNFTKSGVEPVSAGNLFPKSDQGVVVANEIKNKQYSWIYNEKPILSDIVIVSDGYQFEQLHEGLHELPDYVGIFAVNHALRKWKLVRKRSINAYIVNNPYPECLSFLPKNSYYPVCISSLRTYHPFLEKYQGQIYVYEPTIDRTFGRSGLVPYRIDDYRNPICAAIGLAFQFGVRRLMLMCCDDSFESKRDAAVQLDNGLWTYEQHLRSHDIIDANLYWLTHQEDVEVKVVNWSSGPELINAQYISSVQEAREFFKDEDTTRGNPT